MGEARATQGFDRDQTDCVQLCMYILVHNTCNANTKVVCSELFS